MQYLKSALSILLLFSPIFMTAQSGWTQPKKGMFLKAGIGFVAAQNYYTPLGNEIKTNRFTQLSLSFYGEYGLRDRLTLIAQAPLIKTHGYNTTSVVLGQGDLQLQVKYRFTGSRWPVAVSFGPEIPTGRANAYGKDKNIPGVLINLPTGDGEFNFWTTLAASKSFGKFYASLYSAYDIRTAYDGRRFQNLIQVGGELGYHPVEPLWVNAKMRTQLSQGPSQHPELSFIRGDASTFSTLSLEGYYKPKKNWGTSVSLTLPTSLVVPYHNFYAAPVFSVGLAYSK